MDANNFMLERIVGRILKCGGEFFTPPSYLNRYGGIKDMIPNDNQIRERADREYSRCDIGSNVIAFCKGAQWMKEQLLKNDEHNQKDAAVKECHVCHAKIGEMHAYYCSVGPNVFNG